MEHGDLTGAILDGRYRILEPVAEGAMGVVYRAERVKLGRIVAIKVLHDVLPNELSARKRFEIEAMAMAKLEHPHCASVLDVGIHGDRPYVVMDFVSGQNLKDLIVHGPQPIPRATEIVRQVLSGLAHAHEHGIIHRDIKPANLVLSQKTGLGDHVKVLDFGLARLHDTGQNLTSGLVVGTPAYMAPEQIRGQVLDQRADLYACGVLLFELLTGHKPFHSEKDDPIEVCKMHLSDPIPRLDAMLPGVDFGELEAVVAKALAKQREDRYASAQEYAAAIDAAVPRRPSHQAMPLVPPSQQQPPPGGSIQLASADVMEIGDVSYPPSREVRSADVLSSIPAPPPPAAEAVVDVHARTAISFVGMEVRAGTATPPAGVVVRAGTATPPVGVARGGMATPPAGVARGGMATPPAGVVRAGTTTQLGGDGVRARTATPPAGVGGASLEPSGDVESPPGTFLGLALTPPGGSPRDARVTATAPASLSAVVPVPATAPVPTSGPASALGPAASGLAASGLAPASGSAPASGPAPALGSAPASGPAPASATHVPRRRAIAIAGASLVIVIVVGLAVHATRGKTTASGDAGVGSGVASGGGSGSASPPDPSREILARVNDLLTQGDREVALDLLNRSRHQYPDSATLPYAAGRIYFSKFFWTDGLKGFRDAIRNDPAYRTDPELIKTVLRGFITTPSYNEELASFLREDIGSAAVPFLEETARDHPNTVIRSRAASELRRYHP